MAQAIGAYPGRNGYEIRFDLSVKSVPPGLNTTIVQWSLYAICTNTTYKPYNLNGGTWVASINGTTRSGAAALDFRSTYVGKVIGLGSGELAVKHNTDGSKNIAYAASHNAGSPFGQAATPISYVDLPRIWQAPTSDSTYSMRDITATTATTQRIMADAKGSVLTDAQVQLGDGRLFQSGAWVDVQVSGLTRATAYTFRVRIATANYGWGPWGEWKSFTTKPVVPVLSSASTVSPITRNSATISGFTIVNNGGESPSNVRVQYNTVASEAGATVVTKGSWAPLTIGGLAASTQYFYRPAGYNGGGWGPYAAEWLPFTTLSDAPSDMAPPTFTSVLETTMRLNWVTPAMNGADFVSYYYEVSLSNTFIPLITSGTTSTKMAYLTGLIPGTKYFARVRANATPNNGGYGVASQIMAGITPNSGLRMYISIGTTVHKFDLYTFVGGVRKKVVLMYAHDDMIETE